MALPRASGNANATYLSRDFVCCFPPTTVRDNDVVLAMYRVDGRCCDGCGWQWRLPHILSLQAYGGVVEFWNVLQRNCLGIRH